MRLAFIVTLDFENLKTNAKNNTTNKCVKIGHTVNKKRAAQKDTTRCVKGMIHIVNVGLEKSAPINIKHPSKV